LSIGALARATGVPVETLRTWERRYGFPAPAEREDSGHRRYPLETVERLRSVVRALELGHKPSLVLPASQEALHDLLQLGDVNVASTTAAAFDPEDRDHFVERCLSHVTKLDGDALLLEFERAWSAAGAMEFLVGSLGPFLRRLGENWRSGDLDVGHEHFASEHTREYLSQRWRPVSARAKGPLVVCAAPPGELHVLGLHIAATALSLAGARVTFLGADTPVEEIARVVASKSADAVALSAALGTDHRRLERSVRSLLRAVSRGVPVVAGGAGFEDIPHDVLRATDLRDLPTVVRRLGSR
jgi:methanogenic corrinoid protein MtbC1